MHASRPHHAFGLVAFLGCVVFVAVGAGCNSIWGIDELAFGPASSAVGGEGGSTSGAGGSTGGAGGSTGGMGGAGGPATPEILAVTVADGASSITLPTTIDLGNTIVLLAGSRQPIITPANYFSVASENGGEPSLQVAFTVAFGNEDGSEVSLLSDDGVLAAIVLDHGVPDVVGTVGVSGSNVVTAPSITPSAGALTLLFSVCDQTSEDPSNDGGFVDIAVDAANNGGGSAKELFVWTRVASGDETGNIDVSWDSSRSAAVLLSFH